MFSRLTKLSNACIRHHPGGGRSMCAGSTSSFRVGQGGRLSVEMPKAVASVQISTAWVDSCVIGISRSSPMEAGTSDDTLASSKGIKLDSADLDEAGLSIRVDEESGQLRVLQNTEGGENALDNTYHVEAVVPELFSVDVLMAHGSVSVGKKLKGDCRISIDKGDIQVGVVRGEDIHLSTGSGCVNVDELEGNVDISATDVRARLVNGANVKVNAMGDASSVSLGALYSSAAHVTSEGNVTISTCHGRIMASTDGSEGNVNLGSVNGMAQVCAGGGGTRVHVDALEEGTRSHIRSARGDVAVSMSAEVHADIDITGEIKGLPSTFDGEVHATKATGTIVHAGAEPTRGAWANAEGAGGGKVDLTGARDQSLRQYFSRDTASTTRPQFTVTALKGSVALETLSWADNITRKFVTNEASHVNGEKCRT